jgi:hypothetical protein
MPNTPELTPEQQLEEQRRQDAREKFDKTGAEWNSKLSTASCTELEQMKQDLGPFNPENIMDPDNAKRIAVGAKSDSKGCHKR